MSTLINDPPGIDTDLDQLRQAAKDRPIGGMARSGWMQRVAPRTAESEK